MIYRVVFKEFNDVIDRIHRVLFWEFKNLNNMIQFCFKNVKKVIIGYTKNYFQNLMVEIIGLGVYRSLTCKSNSILSVYSKMIGLSYHWKLFFFLLLLLLPRQISYWFLYYYLFIWLIKQTFHIFIVYIFYFQLVLLCNFCICIGEYKQYIAWSIMHCSIFILHYFIGMYLLPASLYELLVLQHLFNINWGGFDS